MQVASYKYRCLVFFLVLFNLVSVTYGFAFKRANKGRRILDVELDDIDIDDPTAIEEEIIENNDPEIVILFLCLSFVIGTATSYIITRVPAIKGLPYTVVVFTIGIIAGIVNDEKHPTSGLGRSILLWDNINPELILFLFLPALLFGEAMFLNIHQVRQTIFPAMLLAGPGAIFGTFAIGILTYWLLPSWSFNISLLFGAILCATDPVAVVALLKSCGAPTGLTYVIIGEALLNDGAALVLYNLLAKLVTIGAEPLTPLSVLWYFARVIVISPLVGLSCGFCAYGCLRLANRRMHEDDKTMQFAVTLICAYLSFFLAEHSLEVSGVISCVTAGLVQAAYAPPIILNPETMHTVWSAIEWCGNTLIFMLAGLLIGDRVIQELTWRHFFVLLVVYFFVVIVRMAMFVLAMPALARFKPSFHFNDTVFMTWGGLRGAVSMALALSLNHATQKGDTVLTKEQGHLIFFLVGGVAALTLLVNANTSAQLLKYLNLLDDTNEGGQVATEMMLNYARRRLYREAMNIVDAASLEHPGQLDFTITQRYCKILKDFEKYDYDLNQGYDGCRTTNDPDMQRVEEEVMKNLPPNSIYTPNSKTSGSSSPGSSIHSERQLLSGIDSTRHQAMLAGTRAVFLEVVRVGYWKQIEIGKLPRSDYSAILLLKSIDQALDEGLGEGLKDWFILLKSIVPYLGAPINRGTSRVYKMVCTDESSSHSQDRVQLDYVNMPISTPPPAPRRRAGGVETEDNITVQSVILDEVCEDSPGQMNVDTAVNDLRMQMKHSNVALTVHCLISFIEAHKYAQDRIAYYLGGTDGKVDLDHMETVEQRLVVDESKDLVDRAREQLSMVDPLRLRKNFSRNSARWILHKQEDVIDELQREGILTSDQASLLQEEVDWDILVLENENWWKRTVIGKSLLKLKSYLKS